MKHKKGTTITNAFLKNLKEPNRKPNKLWVNKGTEFYNRSIELWLEKSDLEMYSMHTERKSVTVERFLRTLRTLRL